MQQRARAGVASKAKAAAPVAARPSLARAGRRATVTPRAQAVAAPAKVSQEQIDRCVNAIRFLAIDAVNKAKSGHPGLPMGAAPMAYVLFNEAMKYNPKVRPRGAGTRTLARRGREAAPGRAAGARGGPGGAAPPPAACRISARRAAAWLRRARRAPRAARHRRRACRPRPCPPLTCAAGEGAPQGACPSIGPSSTAPHPLPPPARRAPIRPRPTPRTPSGSTATALCCPRATAPCCSTP
jgi:hypothetical protein